MSIMTTYNGGHLTPGCSDDVVIDFPAHTTHAPHASPVWIFYEDPTTLPGTNCDSSPVRGWVAQGGPTGDGGEGLVLNWWFSMTADSNAPPLISSVTALHALTSPGEPQEVHATITDCNRASPESAGVAEARLEYSTDAGAFWQSAPMAGGGGGGDDYQGLIPPLPFGSRVNYRVRATDLSGETSLSPVFCYHVAPSFTPSFVLDTLGRAYSWIEIHSTGVRDTAWFQKGFIPSLVQCPPVQEPLPPSFFTVGPVDLGMDFSLLGDSGGTSLLRYAWIGFDGAICLTASASDTALPGTLSLYLDQSPGAFPPVIPNVKMPRNFIAPLLSQYAPLDAILTNSSAQTTGGVYHKQIGTQFIVEWDSLCYAARPGPIPRSFELILDSSDSSITFQYKQIDDPEGSLLSSALVGVQATPTRAILASAGGYPQGGFEPRSGRAITIRPGRDFFLYETPLPGWALFSLPVTATGDSSPGVTPSALFGGATGKTVFAYNGSAYVQPGVLEQGKGYWVNATGTAHQWVFEGPPLLQDTISLSPGWNLVGSVAAAVQVDSIETIPPCGHCLTFYTYDTSGSYQASSVLEPGVGYWVRTSASGVERIILSAPRPSSSSGSAAGSATRVTPRSARAPAR